MSEEKFEYDHTGQQTFDKLIVSDSNETKLQKIIDQCEKNPFLYKFISANDAGSTGSHQSGIYLPNSSWPFYFDSEGVKGKNKDRFVKINWETEGLETKSRFIWYGEKTRREYRLTRFGREFPYLKDDYIGSLMLLVKTGEDEICGWVLDRDDEIENFLSQFNISHLDRGNIRIPQRKGTDIPENVFNQNQLVEDFIRNLKGNPPKGTAISEIARQICASSERSMDADEKLVNRVNAEYQIYLLVEHSIHQPFVNAGNHTLEEILKFSLSVLNSRKSRAGKSLEYQLAAIFDEQRIPYSHGEISEGHSRPDFIFPGITAYHDSRFNSGHLVFLGSKTTCKDRWRQILTEAKRINRKHLFTLQQGISSNQLGEMEQENVTLVVPKVNLNSFPEPWRPKLMTLGSFVQYVRTTSG
jgi:type II restriction enzyme